MTPPPTGAVAARIQAIATHLPDAVLSNAMLAQSFPEWSADRILTKLGISERRIAAPDETASDLAYEAACKLFAEGAVRPEDIDFLIFCTQAPDYVLPTSACILQARLELRRDIGAFDINLGCSGFVYGLSIATGLIASAAANKVLLLTADTYSKYINVKDRSVRTLFGDGAAATLISRDPDGSIGPFVFGTDGEGARSLIVETGGYRMPRSLKSGAETSDSAGNVRSRDNLYMNGAAVMSFTLREVPQSFRDLLSRSGATITDYDFIVVHQANKFLMDALQKKLDVPSDKFPHFHETIGNTVSSTIPFVLEHLLAEDRLARGQRLVLLGFGVGLSWAGVDLRW